MSERLPYRLPHHVTPHHYHLEIEPDLPGAVFRGRVAIDITVKDPCRDITLNALDLTIQDAKIGQGHRSWPAQVALEPDEEQVVLAFPEVLDPGEYRLTLEYAGILGSAMAGFYRTEARDPDGNPIFIAATQCEQTDARRVFPGWDEPEFKAVFSITLIVPDPLAAFSNTQEIDNVPCGGGKRRVTFAPTIPMSTYLVALVVGPLQATEPRYVGPVPLRVVSRAGFESMRAFALQAAADALQYFQDYFGMAYPSDKLDHIAIPDFAAGAMENLGCVTYREELLLLDPSRSSPIEQYNTVATISHETAHMWFGDLVTMRWWDGIWLNEAFATFMELHATAHLHPEWDPWAVFSRGKAMAMAVDGLAHSRPVEYPVGRPAESWAMFDVLTYQKGGAVLRMLEQYLGEETFRQSIIRYLTQHRFGNAESGDLWNALEGVSHQPVGDIMHSWIHQAGLPLVQASLSDDGAQLILSQTPFRYDGRATGSWQIPIAVAITPSDGEMYVERRLLHRDPVDIELSDPNALLVVNAGGWGFYRMAYDQTLAARLSQHLARLTALERFQLLDDAWATMLAGNTPLSQVVRLWRGLTEEQDPDIWSAIASNVALLRDIADHEALPALAALVQDIADPVLKKLGLHPVSGEDVRQARTRAGLVQLLGVWGEDRALQQWAHQQWRDHIDGRSELAPELVGAVIRVVAHSGDDRDWQTMYDQFKHPATPQDEQRYLYGLARFTHRDLLQRTLQLYLSDEVRQQDGIMALEMLLSNRYASQMTWEAIESHWDDLLARYPSRLLEYFGYAISQITDEQLGARMKAWFDQHPILEIERPLNQAFEFQAIHSAFKRRIQPRLALELAARRE